VRLVGLIKKTLYLRWSTNSGTFESPWNRKKN